MFTSHGRVHYDDNDGFRLTVEVNQNLSDYYRSLIPKYYPVQRPRWMAHITVVRPNMEIPPKIRYWGDYEGELVKFMYDPYIHCDKGYYWLNIFCTRLENIREELGLPVTSRFTLPPSGFKKCFHCTIGNYKDNY